MKKWLLLAMLLGLALSGFAQSNYGSITGLVTDSQHLPIVGAKIDITSTSTGAARRVETQQQGIFEFAALLPEEYQLQVQAPGFATTTQTVRLEVGQ